MIPYFWMGIIILSLITEALTVSLVAVWFIPGAVAALVISLIWPDLLWLQLLLFVLFSCSIIFRFVFKEKFVLKKVESTNADALIGKKAIVTEKIDNIAQTGAVRINGQEWTARASDEANTYEKGSIVEIKAIQGVKLICKGE